MKYIFVILLLFAPFANADGFFDDLLNGVDAFWTLFTVDAPNAIERFFAWLLKWATYLKLYLQLEAIKLAWGVAKALLIDLSITNIMNQWIANLEPDLRYVIQVTKLLDAFMLIIEALITRYVLRFF